MFARLETYFDSLTCQGTGQGYYHEPSNSVMIVRPENLEAGKEFRACHGFKICTSELYLRGYIGDDKSKRDWMRERTLTWEKNTNTIRKTAGKYPKENYSALVRTIQSAWIFLQRVTWDTGEAFTGVEKIIQETFLPRLFFGNTKTFSPIVVALSMMPVKKSGLGLLNPVTSSQDKYLAPRGGARNWFRPWWGEGHSLISTTYGR